MLENLAGEGIRLCFAEMKGPVKDQLKRYGLFEAIGPDSIFSTIESAESAESAVRRYVAETRVEWPEQDHARGAAATSR